MAKLDLDHIRRVRVNDGDIENLADEIELLQSIVRDIANRDPGGFTGARWHCVFCKQDEDINLPKVDRHKPHCEWRRAKELLRQVNISVAVPSIAPRATMLTRCLNSITAQTLPAKAVSISFDTEKQGAAVNRQHALDAVQTEWVAFIDDDDWMYPEHLETLARGAEEHGADYVFSYYMVHDNDGNALPGVDPLTHFGKEFNPDDPHQTTITTLVRTELAKSVGFHNPAEGQMIHGQALGEDFQFTVGCVAAGAKIVHVPTISWAWCHHQRNTSGRPIW